MKILHLIVPKINISERIGGHRREIQERCTRLDKHFVPTNHSKSKAAGGGVTQQYGRILNIKTFLFGTDKTFSVLFCMYVPSPKKCKDYA